MGAHDSRQAGVLSQVEAIEVTPAMIEAGVAELRERHFGEPVERIVESLFTVMLAAQAT